MADDDGDIAGRLYQGKPSDMWALGVLLYTMLYGQFPFYDNTPHELFRKIKAVEYSIPEYVTQLPSYFECFETFCNDLNVVIFECLCPY